MLNDELHGRNEELSHVNSDLVNLLGSVQIAILMVSGDLRIRRFTPMAEKILNLIPSDIGRPIGHIKPNIDCQELEKLIREVVDTMTVVECEVRDDQGHWYSLRIRPYKNLENRIDGAVLALFDIHAMKQHAEEVAEIQAYADGLLELIEAPAVVLDDERRVRSAYSTFASAFDLPPSEALGKPLEQLHGGAWAAPAVRALLDPASAAQSDGNHELTAQFPGMGLRTLRLHARRFKHRLPQHERILLLIKDVNSADG